MRTHHLPLIGLLSLLGACQEPLPTNTPDAGVIPVDTGLAAVDTGLATDQPVAPADGPAETAAYTPTGCAHRVTALMGTFDNYRGDTATFGPMPAPRGVHVGWPADPATAAAFVWRTDGATRASAVQYGTDPAALTQTAVGSVSTGGSGANELTVHEVHVCGLTPDTTYHYRVGGEGHWSDVQRFKTAPAPGRADYDVNFAVSGDSRDSPAIWGQVQRQVMAGTQPAEFQLFSGDAVLLGSQQGAWGQWFDGAQPTMAVMPFVMAHGNHDVLAINYLMQFAQPQADAVEQSELYFSFDYGPIHFVFLNDSPRDLTGSIAGTQLTWLRADLGRARANRSRVPWIIAVHHKPAFASSQHSNEADTALVRMTWPPVFDEFGVDLVLNGHEHDFEISKEVDGQGQEVSGRRGTRYIVAAGAGAQLYTLSGSARPWSSYFESVVNFLRIHATMTRLEVTPFRLDGTIIDRGRVSLTPRPM
jgi:hypothetical protein